MKNIEEMLSEMAHKVDKDLALELVFTSEIEDTETWKKFLQICTYAAPKDRWVEVYAVSRCEENQGDPYHWDPGMTLLDKWSYINNTRNAWVTVKHYKNLARKELEELRRKEMETEEA